MDSSRNGKWLLATCPHYLLVIPTFANGVDGFKKRLGKEKPTPRKLTILPKDLAKMGVTELCFQNAKFDDKKTKKQSYIVTSVGQWLITWRLVDVILGKTKKYQIKLLGKNIIAQQFKFDQDRIIVAHKNELGLHQSKKQR